MRDDEYVYVGVDNGISGAVAILERDGSILVFKMPICEFGSKGTFIDDLELRALLLNGRDPKDLRVTAEWAQKQPKFGCKTNWAQGFHGGVLATLFRQNGIRATFVNPKEWQSQMLASVRIAGQDTKVASIATCHKLFPQVSLIPPRGRVEHDGIADALLMAEFGRRNKL